jgi:glycosyltransferase involved in cell wall biosynthesis
VHAFGPQPATEVRNFLAGSDVVVVPSVRTPTFREPWGLVVNEAMHRALPVIASTEVGAAAGGLVRHEVNGLVVPAGDDAALASALGRLRGDEALRARLGAQAARDAASYTPEAWAAGVSAALRDAGASRRPH